MSEPMIGHLMQVYRVMNRIGVRELAKDIGISPATVSRIENGFECDQNTLFLLLHWLFKPKRKEMSDE